MLRRTCVLVCAVVLNGAFSEAPDEKRTRSIQEDKALLTASKWQNEKPEGAWQKLSYKHKEQLGGKPWKRVELEIKKTSKSADPRPGTHSAQLSFFKSDGEKFSLGIIPVVFREEKGERLLVGTNLDKVEYKIEYEFKGDKLQMRGLYLRRGTSSGAIFIPEIFDGEYTPIPLKKE